MENMGLGLELMGIGMVTVFAILLIVIFGSRLLITIINRIAPEESKPEKAAPAADDTAAVRPAVGPCHSRVSANSTQNTAVNSSTSRSLGRIS